VPGGCPPGGHRASVSSWGALSLTDGAALAVSLACAVDWCPGEHGGENWKAVTARGALPRTPTRRSNVTNLFRRLSAAVGRPTAHDSYLVDSASSHMLVSKIKPCMSKYKQLYRETANGSLNQLSFI
jgi:hypothetical protein